LINHHGSTNTKPENVLWEVTWTKRAQLCPGKIVGSLMQFPTANHRKLSQTYALEKRTNDSSRTTASLFAKHAESQTIQLRPLLAYSLSKVKTISNLDVMFPSRSTRNLVVYCFSFCGILTNSLLFLSSSCAGIVLQSFTASK